MATEVLTWTMRRNGTGANMIDIPAGTSETTTYPFSATWSVDTTQYRIISIAVRFTTNQAIGRIREATDGTTIASYGSTTRSVTSGQPFDWDMTPQFPSLSSGTFTAKFSPANEFRNRYTDITLVVTVEELAEWEQSRAIIQDAIVGQPQTVTLVNDNANVYHDVTWTYGSVTSGVKHYTATQRAPSWAVPTASVEGLIRSQTASTIIAGTVTVTTYQPGGTVIGTTQWRANLIISQEQAGPDIAIDEASRTQDEHTATRTDIVQHHTAVQINPLAMPLRYGATLRNIRYLTPDGEMIVIPTGTETGLSDYGVSYTPATAGSVTVRAVLTDSRGLTATAEIQLDVTPCAPPVFTTLDAYRSDANGAANDEGSYIRVVTQVTVSALTTLRSVQARVLTADGSSEIVSYTALTDDGGYLVATLAANLSPDDTCQVQLRAEDNLRDESSQTSAGQVSHVIIGVGTSIYTIHRMAGGKGVCFGQVASRYGVEICEQWPLYTHGQEILELLMDTAHPLGSVIRTADPDWDPNTAWPWTLWGRIGTETAGGIDLTIWARGR